MWAIFIGRPSHSRSGHKPTHWVAVADYSPGNSLPEDVPNGPSTKGLGDFPLAVAREIANEEAGRLGLPVVDLTGTPQIA